MNHEKIDRMKQEYEQIEVPEALKTQVEAGIRNAVPADLPVHYVPLHLP